MAAMMDAACSHPPSTLSPRPEIRLLILRPQADPVLLMRKPLMLIALAGLAALGACKPTPPASVRPQSALDVMERVMVNASSCWFRSGDPAFKAYRMDAELTSYSGQPRILLVRKGTGDIRPHLVVMAQGSPAKLQAFGPMMDEPLAGRVSADVKRWANGSSACH